MSVGGGLGGYGGPRGTPQVRLGPPGPVPPTVKALLIANVAIHVLKILSELSMGPLLVSYFALVPIDVVQGQVWRLLSYQFLHGGTMHLALNCLMLWMFGAELEQRWGARFFLKYYLLCGLAGGLLFVLVRSSTFVPTLGASGAIYGILMAYGMWFPNREVLLAFVFPVQVRYLVFVLMAIEFLQTLESAGSGGVAHAAHLGGAGFGYLYLRWWGVGGLGMGALPGWKDLRRSYYRWRFKRLQRRRFGGDDGPTLH